MTLFLRMNTYHEIIVSMVFISISCIFLALTLRRNNISKFYPSRLYPFYSIWGDLTAFSFSHSAENYNGYPVTTYILQVLEGLSHLFSKESIFCVWLGYTHVLFLNTPEAIEKVLSGTNTIQKAWFYDLLHCWIGTGLLTSYGSKWKSRRKLLTPAFHFDILKEFLPIVNEKSMILVKKLKEETTQPWTNIIPFITLCSLDIICETTLGVDINAMENNESYYVKAVARVSEVITRRIIVFWSWFDFTFFLGEGRIIKGDLKRLHNFTKSIIQKRKSEIQTKKNGSVALRKRKPLIDVLLEHHIQNKDLTELDIREEVDTFTFEGHDTTSLGMIWTLYLIGLYKENQNKIVEELDHIFGDDKKKPIGQDDLKDIKYLEYVIKEALRLYPSVPAIGRINDADINICGYHVPKGTTLAIVPYVLHRNEKIFPDPEIFDPSRFLPENCRNRHPFAYIPFSAGSRNCIGQRFAMMEMKTVLANILRNFEVESLDPRDKSPPCLDIVLRPTVEIKLKIKCRT